MARADILNVLYSKDKSPLEFKFDSLWLPSLYNYVPVQDIQQLYNIATSVKYNAKIEMKYNEISRIMNNLGFKKLASGTNRIVYSFLEDQSFVVKIALDKVGLKDNPDEFRNQNLLRPFVTKVFEVSPCGTIGTFERVEPITSNAEFAYMAGDVFELLNNFIIGKYVLEDIGTKYFMNWGVRKGFGPCLLDFPYVYELDGNKLHCSAPLIPHTKFPVCDGDIDYDNGYNNLVCSSCGQRYFAHDLQQKIDQKLIIIKGDSEMTRVRIVDTSTGVVICDPGVSSDFIKPGEYKKEKAQIYSGPRLVVSTAGGRFEPMFPVNPVISNQTADKLSRILTTPPNTFTSDSHCIKPSVTTAAVQKTNGLDDAISSYIKEDPMLVVGNHKSILGNQETEVSPEWKVDVKDTKEVNTPTEQFVIYNILGIAMKDYPFHEDEKADSVQREKIVAFLIDNLDTFVDKNNMNITESSTKIVEDYVNTNYTFSEIEKSDSVLAQFGIADGDFEDPITKQEYRIRDNTKYYRADDVRPPKPVVEPKKVDKEMDNY